MSTKYIDAGICLDVPFEWEAVIFNAVLEIDYDYDPGQQEILNPPDKAQEGIPESLDINSVKLFDEDITELVNLTKLEEYILNERTEPDEDG